MLCIRGPGAREGPTGFVALANGGDDAALLLADVAHAMLRKLAWRGIDLGRVRGPLRAARAAAQDGAAPQSFKDLVFDAFEGAW